jgi:hypothetical protein
MEGDTTNKLVMLEITKDTHPTEVAWLEKNGDLVPWDRVKTLDQLREFVEQRVAQRMELGQYDLTAEGTILAEQSEMRALTIKARKGDLEAVRAIELHEKGGWEMVIKGHYNRKRNSNLDLWKWYLKEENLEYAQDPFWQDLVWDIPVSYLQERGNFGIGKIAALKPGVLDKLRDDVEFENIDLPKAYRELMQQLADSSEEDLPREGNSKTWVYIPWEGEDPENFQANVEKLDRIVPKGMKDERWRSESILRDDGSIWLLRDKRRVKVAIQLNIENTDVMWIRDEWGKEKIPDEYFEDVLYLLRKGKLPSLGYVIPAREKDPKRQMELAKTDNLNVLLVLAENKDLIPEVQIILAKSNKIAIEQRLGSKENIVAEAQIILAKSKNKGAFESLSKNPSIVPEAQLILVESGLDYVHANLASNPSVIPEVQGILVKHENRWVRLNLAANGRIHPEYQLVLANSDDAQIKGTLARYQKLSDAALSALLNSKESGVKLSLLENKYLTPEMHAKVQTTIAESGDIGSKKFLAQKSYIVPEAQLILAKSNDERVHYELAENQNIIAEAQIILARSEDYQTQEILASNPRVTTQAQIILAQSKFERTQEKLAQNQSITTEAQLILATSGTLWAQRHLARNESIDPKIQLLLAKSQDEVVQENLAENYKLCSIPAFHCLIDSPYPEVRYKTRYHPKLPWEVWVVLRARDEGLEDSRKEAQKMATDRNHESNTRQIS